MDDTNWLRQTKDKPLFPDILWSRPENKTQSGKLLIIGGNQHAFSAVAAAYSSAVAAGAGSVRTVLPDRLRATIGKIFPEAEFAPSTLSGSFSKLALAMLLEEASWADGVLLAGDFGRNSETAILLESFADKHPGLLALSGDSIDYFIKSPEQITDREQTVIICGFSQAQKILARQALLKHDMDLKQLTEALSVFTKDSKPVIVTQHSGNSVVAYQGRVSTTQGIPNLELLAPSSIVFGIQNPGKLFEAITCSVYSV